MNGQEFSIKENNEIKKKLIKSNKFSPLKRTVLAHYVTSKNTKKDIFSNSTDHLKKEIFKIHIAGYGLFFIILFFFELISMTLALLNNIQVDFIIFLSLIGFVFSYTLLSVTIDPIMYLLIQKRVFEEKS